MGVMDLGFRTFCRLGLRSLIYVVWYVLLSFHPQPVGFVVLV